MKKQTEKRAGFTLAELMVVIVIIGLLVTVVMPNVIGYLAQGRWARVQADIRAIDNAVERYNVMNGARYPNSLDDLLQPDINGHAYLKKKSLPKDPWGNEYMYDPPSSGSSADYRIYTYGADGAPGGEADDRDYDQIDLQEE